YSVTISNLGLPIRWFKLAMILFLVFLIYNVCFPMISFVQEEYRYIFYSLNDFSGFAGLLIAYPVICHYAARAISVRRNGNPATFVSALPFTLVLIFGSVLGIPFFHKYFSTKTSAYSEINIIYAISLGLFMAILIIGFIASIAGLI
ncbi:hypothetical protein OAE12_01540, partial [bacterium]|nr:hypothetical protein [bacterium]